MKRKRADRPNWQRVIKKRFAMMHLENKDFRGYVSLFCIDDVREPLWLKLSGKDMCLANKGYSWLQHFPQGACHTITTIFDEQGEFVRWYIDICKQHFLDENGILWYDDLYLDIDLSADGEIDLLDVDELDEALRNGKVSSLEYELAWREASGLMTTIEEGMFPLLWLCELHRDHLLKLVQAS